MAVSLRALADETAAGEEQRERRGSAYLGAFFVTSMNSHVNVFSQDAPIGARVDLSEDLGLKDSMTVPRLAVGWRFGKKHILGFGWYDLVRDGNGTIPELIPPPERQTTDESDVQSTYRTEVYRLSYTWMFHQDSKVGLGIGGGLFVAGVTAGIRADGYQDSPGRDRSFTAPLPMIGGRLTYQVTPKLEFLAYADLFMMNYAEYSGGILDLQLFVSHRTFKHVGFGGGINVQALGVDIDQEDYYWQVSDSLLGFLVVTTFSF